MNWKLIEIRDEGTCIPAMAIHLSGRDPALSIKQQSLLRRAGYGEKGCILLIDLARPLCHYDPYEWDYSRTMRIAHQEIEKTFNTLVDGAVLDVRFVLGEADKPAESDVLVDAGGGDLLPPR